MKNSRSKPRPLGRGLTYDKATRTAKISVYKKGAKGDFRIRRTLHHVSAEEAEKAMCSLRAKANGGLERPALVAPTLRAFYDAYFDLIAERLSSTAESYRLVIERLMLPALRRDAPRIAPYA